jgi:hypothetical protein
LPHCRRADDPDGEVSATQLAKEAVRELYFHTNAELGAPCVERLGKDAKILDNPIELRSLDRTLRRQKHQIAVWRNAKVNNGPTQAANPLINRVKRSAFCFHQLYQ